MSDHDDETIDVRADDERSGDRPRDPLLLAVIGLVAAVLLFLTAAIPVLRERGDAADGPPASSSTPVATAPASTVVTTIETSTTTSVGPSPAATAPAAAPDSTAALAPDSTGVPTTAAPDSTAVPAAVGRPSSPATSDAAADDLEDAGGVPESVAVVEDGRIYLSGAVPDEESMVRIVDLAGAVLGPQNVINEYTIDPRASDPNLGNIRVDDHILFEPGTATIAAEFEPLLNQALALMTIRPSVTMHVVGHTDDRGSLDYNHDLSERRALAVVQWLTDRGVDPGRLTSEGRGELAPIATNETAAGRALNRRIQVFLANLLSDDVDGDAVNDE